MENLWFSLIVSLPPCQSICKEGLQDTPSGHVGFTENQQLLMIGQKYKIVGQIDLPKSPVNEKIGTFMLCIRLKDKYRKLVLSSCRLFDLAGISAEKQVVQLEMYTDFVEDQLHPITDIHFEVFEDFSYAKHDIQIYSAKITIISNLSGLRYLMFHWRIFTALLGIGSNLLFVLFVFSMSWQHIYGSEAYKNQSSDLSDRCDQLVDFESESDSSSMMTKHS